MQIVNVVKDSFIESAPFNWGISLFSFGCNLECSFCKGYNYETVTNPNNIRGEVIETLEKEVQPCHDCVIFIGGEPTIWGDDLINALKWCKEHDKKTKIFSNGYNSNLIKEINDLCLCDAWSIDFKGLKDKVSCYVSEEDYYDNDVESIKDIINHNLPLEIRTTYFTGNEEDKEAIRKELKSIEEYMNLKGFNNYYKYFEQKDFRETLNKKG